MTRFFVPAAAVQGDQVVITGQDLHHLSRVLRLGPGDRVVALTGDGIELEVELLQVGPEQAVGRIAGRRQSAAEPPFQVVLVQGLAKGDKMDLIVQKCTEVGVTRFLPVETERAVVRLEPAKAAQRQARWQVIAREAAEQSRRGRVPAVSPVGTLKSAVAEAARAMQEAPGQVLALIPWEEESGRGLFDVLQRVKRGGPAAGGLREGAVPEHGRPEGFLQEYGLHEVWLFIGPEGGFSHQEAALAREAGVEPVSLGPRILRTETAGLAATTMVLYALGDLGRAARG